MDLDFLVGNNNVGNNKELLSTNVQGPSRETLLCDGGSRVEVTVMINCLAVKIDPHLAHLDFVPEC